jgi:hypothetical protein
MAGFNISGVKLSGSSTRHLLNNHVNETVVMNVIT